jgi:hypothetical protein
VDGETGGLELTEEPDYAPYLTRAENHGKQIYPSCADRKWTQAAYHTFRAVAEYMDFLTWLADHLGITFVRTRAKPASVTIQKVKAK